MKGYVTYQGRRYRVINPDRMHPGDLLRLRPFKGPDIMVSPDQVKPWKRGSVRHVRGKLPHRGKRPVHLDIDTGAEIITARLKGTRKRFTCTFGGLYDLLARQQVLNTKRDRAFARRTRR